MSRDYSGRTAVDRVTERREKLISAGIQIVGAEGVPALTMRAVCREAALSPKFFYESFADIDALLHEVYAVTLQRLRSTVLAAARGADLAAITGNCVDAAARLMEEDPGVCRILLVEPIADQRLRLYVRETVPALMKTALADLGLKLTDSAQTRMHFATLFGALISLFIEWTEGNLGKNRKAFAEHVTQLILASPPLAQPRQSR